MNIPYVVGAIVVVIIR